MKKTIIKRFNKTTLGLLIALAIMFVTSLASFGGIFTASASTTDNLFDGGDGTQYNPYQISNEEQLNNINEVPISLTGYTYYVLTADIELTGTYSDGYIVTYFQGELNGSWNGATHKIISSNDAVYFTLYTCHAATFTNINIYQKGSGFFGLVCYGGFVGDTSILASNQFTLSFSNVKVYSSDKKVATQLGNNDSAFVAMTYDGYVTFDKCVNYATLNYATYGGIFLGGYTMGSKIVYSKCVNEGVVTGVKVGFFNGNTHNDLSTIKLVNTAANSDRVSGYTSVYVSNCYNIGTITGSTSCSAFASNTGTEKK